MVFLVFSAPHSHVVVGRRFEDDSVELRCVLENEFVAASCRL